MRTSHLFAMGNRAGLVAARSTVTLTATTLLAALGCGEVNSDDQADARQADAGTGADGELADGAPGADGGPGACRPQVAWHQGPEGSREVWVSDIDGGNARNLSQSENDDSGAVWSPRGDRIAFVSRATGGDRNVVVAPAEGGAAVPLSVGSEPSWSPDGSLVAFIRGDQATRRLWIAAVDGSSPPRLVVDVPMFGFSWSPDGSRFVYSAQAGATTRDLWVVEASLTATGEPRRIVFTGDQYEDNPQWSPDGARIAYETIGGGNDVWTVAPDGSGAVNLTASTASSRERGVRWAADGAQLVFTTNREGSRKLFRVAAAGGPAVRVLDNALPADPSGDLADGVSPDGNRVGFTRTDYSTAERPSAVGVVTLDGLEVRTFEAAQSAAPSWSPCAETGK